MKLVVITVPGNWFNVQAFVNGHNLADAVVSIANPVGNYTNIALKINEEQEEELRLKGWLRGDL
jgi:hypothetical protein